MMECRRFKIVVMAGLLYIFATLGYADLRGLSFSSLVQESEIIVIAKAGKPLKGKDSARLEIVEILKGAEVASVIDIKWSAEIHDQKIQQRGVYLLFLSKHGGASYSGTHYGRSYWKLNKGVDENDPCHYFTTYTYPINTVIINSPYLTTHESNNSKTQTICLGHVKQAIIDFL